MVLFVSVQQKWSADDRLLICQRCRIYTGRQIARGKISRGFSTKRKRSIGIQEKLSSFDESRTGKWNAGNYPRRSTSRKKLIHPKHPKYPEPKTSDGWAHNHQAFSRLSLKLPVLYSPGLIYGDLVTYLFSRTTGTAESSPTKLSLQDPLARYSSMLHGCTRQ